MPIRIRFTDFLKFGFVNVNGASDAVWQTVCAAMGWYPAGHLGWLPEWEAVCYPASQPTARAPAQYGALTMLLGHISLAILSTLHGHFLLPFFDQLRPILQRLALFFMQFHTARRAATCRLGFLSELPDIPSQPTRAIFVLAYELAHRTSYVRCGPMLPSGGFA